MLATRISSTPTIAVIDPAMETPALTAINELSGVSPLPITVHLPLWHGITSVYTLDQDLIAGVIVLGSNSSVNSPSLRQDMLETWLTQFCSYGRPVLGICFGHQLLASIFGAKVTNFHPDKRKTEGFREVEFQADDRLRLPACRRKLVVSHNEVVVSAPSGFEVFATSDEHEIEALRHKERPIWSVQAHPEATQHFLYSQGIRTELPLMVKEHGLELLSAFFSYVHSSLDSSSKQ